MRSFRIHAYLSLSLAEMLIYAVDGGARDKVDEEGDGSQGPTYASIWQAIPPTKAIILYMSKLTYDWAC